MSKEQRLFMGVIRNEHAIAREDNPNKDADNEAYQEARNVFITEIKSQTHSETLDCECCNLEMIKGYHVHHEDGDHTNNDKSNFRIRCPLCHLVSHLGFVGVERLGIIVYCPEFTQAQLNSLQTLYFMLNKLIGSTKKGSREYQNLVGYHNNLKLLYQAIESSSAKVIRNFKNNDPLHFANAMLGMSEDEYSRRADTIFNGLRVLYREDAFDKEIDLWTKQYFVTEDNNKLSTHPEQWPALLKIFTETTRRHT
ncbi:HNH endonuclease [Vibrio fluvialis]